MSYDEKYPNKIVFENSSLKILTFKAVLNNLIPRTNKCLNYGIGWDELQGNKHPVPRS